MTKYHNVSTVYGGERYASKAEAAFAARLDRLKAAGAPEVRDWRRGQTWVLLLTPSGRRLTYRPDFEVEDAAGRLRVVDVKGAPPTEVFRIKALLWEATYPDVPLRIVRGDGEEGPA